MTPIETGASIAAAIRTPQHLTITGPVTRDERGRPLALSLIDTPRIYRFSHFVSRLIAGWLRQYGYNPDIRPIHSRDLMGWLTYCVVSDIEPLTALATDVDTWAQLLTDQGAPPQLIHRKVTEITAWNTWLAGPPDPSELPPPTHPKTD